MSGHGAALSSTMGPSMEEVAGFLAPLTHGLELVAVGIDLIGIAIILYGFVISLISFFEK